MLKFEDHCFSFTHIISEVGVFNYSLEKSPKDKVLESSMTFSLQNTYSVSIMYKALQCLETITYRKLFFTTMEILKLQEK